MCFAGLLSCYASGIMQIRNRRSFYAGVLMVVLGLVYALSGLLFTHRTLSILAGSLCVLSGILALSRGAFRASAATKLSTEAKE